MTEVKVVIGERSFNVACNPGEQSDVMESAKLLNSEAESIQEQLGRLPEDKLLLLSGLMIGDRLRTLNLKLLTLQEKINQYEEANENTVDKKDSPPVAIPDKGEDEKRFEKIADSLEEILTTVAKYEESKFNNSNESEEKEIQNSFL